MANFYRKKNTITGVDDLFNADTNSYISATQFGKGVGFTEVKAPPQPVAQPVDQPNKIDSTTLKVGMSSPDIVSRLPDNTASSAALKVYTQNTQKDATKTSADLQSEIDRIKALQITDAQANVEKANKAVSDYNAGVQPAIDTYKENLTNQGNAISSVYTTDYYKSLLTDKKSITDEIIGYSKLIDEAVNTASGGATLASVASGRKNAVIADYGAKISVKQAALSAIDGNFSLASSILDTGISKLNDYYTNQINFQKLANEIFNTSEIKELTSKAITDLETKQKALEETKTAIQTLMSDPDTAVIAQKANVLLTDTAEQVAQKLNDFYAKNPGYNTENIASNKSLITKYPDAGITLYDTPETVQTKLAQSKIYQKETATKADLPSSYQEWVLAGSPGTYAEWVKDKNGSTPNIIKIDGKDYQVNPDGSFSVPNIPQVTEQEKIDKSNKVLSAVKDVQDLNWKSVVGMVQGKVPDWSLTGKQTAVKSKIDTLKALLTIENMGIMKGVLSDSDMKIITNASTSLNRSTDEESFNNELDKIKFAAKSIVNSSNISVGQVMDNNDGTYSYKNNDGTTHTGKIGDNYIDNTKPPAPNFNQVDGDTNKATLKEISSIPTGTSGGQCGRFVNSLTGLGVGDTYQSKMAKMDSSIKYPEPGMVFTMPYKDTGHIGFIMGIDGDNAIVKDSNWYINSDPGKVAVHSIPLSKITGLARV